VAGSSGTFTALTVSEEKPAKPIFRSISSLDSVTGARDTTRASGTRSYGICCLSSGRGAFRPAQASIEAAPDRVDQHRATRSPQRRMPPSGSAQGHAYVARTRLPPVRLPLAPPVATGCRIDPVC
jgi:hypothetical protein